jgi:hypothetical protein
LGSARRRANSAPAGLIVGLASQILIAALARWSTARGGEARGDERATLAQISC